MNKNSAGFGRPNNKARRSVQNQRTFRNIQKRRAKHAKSHGVTVESLGARRWTTVPTSKNA